MYAMYTSGTLGNVFAFDPSHWEFYRAVPKGLMRPIDNLISRDRFDVTQFYPPFIEMQKLNGKMWGLPSWGWSGQDGFIYNQVIFQQEGIPNRLQRRRLDDGQHSPVGQEADEDGRQRRLPALRHGTGARRPGASVYTRAYNQPDFYEPNK